MIALHGDLGGIFYSRGQYPEAMVQFQQAHDQARALGDDALRSRMLYRVAVVAINQNDFQVAEKALQDSLALDSTANPFRIQWIGLGLLEERRGNYDRAEAYYQQCLDHLGETGHPDLRCYVLTDLTVIAEKRDDDLRALGYMRKGLDLARDHNLRERVCHFLELLGWLTIKAGNLVQANIDLKEGLAIARRIDQPERIASILANLGIAAQRAGETEQAEAHFQEGLAVAQRIDHGWLPASIQNDLGDLYR